VLTVIDCFQVMGLTYAIVAGIAVPDSRRAVVLVGVEAIITALVGILAAFCSNKFIMIVFICVQSILVIASLIVTIVMIVVANELTEVTFGMVLSIVVVALVFMISGMAIAAAGIWIKLKNTPDAPIKRYKLDRGDDVVL
jgi:hypothetical protein